MAADAREPRLFSYCYDIRTFDFGASTAECARPLAPGWRWQRPDVGGSCCNARVTREDNDVGDCELTTAEFRSGKWMAWLREQNRWVEIPDNVIVREINPSPEQAHLCWAYERVLCFLPPYSDG